MNVVLTPEKPVAGGRMLARHEGQVVLVAGAIPGERVQARIERTEKHLAYAETTEVLEPSPDRRPSSVDWACGGAAYAHISYERQLALKSQLVADAFLRIAKLRLFHVTPVMPSGEHGYRMRARLHVHDGRFGFYREGTHELCAAGLTRQLLPETIDALEQLHTALAVAHTYRFASYEVAENIGATERAVRVEIDGPEAPPLAVGPIAGITGLISAAGLSHHETVAYGSPYIVDHIDVSGVSVALTHHVHSFFQSNRYLLPRMVERVISTVAGDDVVDLYAGVGLFSVSLAAAGHRAIVGIEGDRSSARDLDTNAAPYSSGLKVEHVSVEQYLRRKGTRTPHTLLLDPPRTGMSREAMAGTIALKPRRIVYVSCDLPTLARDAKRFFDAGYRLAHLEAFDLFPNTAHVETLAVFTG